jgi:hypothetical protein
MRGGDADRVTAGRSEGKRKEGPVQR